MDSIISWFINELIRKFNVKSHLDKVSNEAYELYHEEIDESLIPKSHMDTLPNPLILETVFYVDTEGSEWLAGIVVDESSKKWLYTVWIKNKEVISYNFKE